MKGKVFGSDTGSANESWLKEAVTKYGPYEIKSYDYWADAVLDLQAGRLDGVVVDAPDRAVLHPAAPRDRTGHAAFTSTTIISPSRWPSRRVPPSCASFNKVQNEMKKDGTLKAIYVKWFGAEPPADSSAINIVAPYLPNEKPKP